MTHPSPFPVSEKGSAFWIILIAIALFAGLSYALMSGSRNNASTLSNDQARIAAQEIIQYGDTIASAVQKLRLRGCLDTQINFYNTNTSAFGGFGTTNNSNAPTDKSCNVFDSAGGSVTPLVPNPSWKDPSVASNLLVWLINYSNDVKGLGTTSAELAISIPGLTAQLCTTINNILNIQNVNNAPPATNFSDAPAGFTGTYNASPYQINHASLNGQSSFCLDETGMYKLYKVLIVR